MVDQQLEKQLSIIFAKAKYGQEPSLRQIKPDEIIIEFDHVSRDEGLALVKKTCENLKAAGYSFEVWDHGGKSPHIHLTIEGLENYNDKERKTYKENFIHKYAAAPELADRSLATKHWIAAENEVHWKKKYGLPGAESYDVKTQVTKHDSGKPNAIDRELFQKQKQERAGLESGIDIQKVFDFYGLKFNNSGMALCPLHDDHTPSLKIFSETNSFFCFGCSKGGNTYNFVMLKENCDFKTAKEKVLEILGLKKQSTATPQEQEKTSQAEKIVELALNKVTLFHDQFKTPFAWLAVGDHKECWLIKTRGFKRWLSVEYYRAEGMPANPTSINSAITTLEGLAQFEGECIELANRVCQKDNSIYYDLSNNQWQAVRISETGWELVNPDLPMFRRYSHHAPQIVPEKTDAKYFRETFHKFTNIKNKCDQHLATVATVSYLLSDIPKPPLIAFGPQGSAKSTLHKLIRSLIDSSSMKLLTIQNDNKELAQNLAHHYCAFFDNLSHLSDWQSDMLCRAVTGDAFSKRELYTDEEDVIFQFMRCVGINGINTVATKPDFLDRSILIGQERISRKERKSEKEFWTVFNAEKPKLLGSMFDALSKAMRMVNSGVVTLTIKPRMADFAIWGEAISRAMGYATGEFVNAYDKNIAEQTAIAIEAYVIGEPLMVFLKDKSEWTGTATELFATLTQIADSLNIKTKGGGWPRAPNSLSRQLNILKTNLMEWGWEYGREHSGDRKIYFRKITLADDKTPSETSELSKQTSSDLAISGRSMDGKDDTNTSEKPQASDDVDDKDASLDRPNMSQKELLGLLSENGSKSFTTDNIISLAAQHGMQSEITKQLIVYWQTNGTIAEIKPNEWKLAGA